MLNDEIDTNLTDLGGFTPIIDSTTGEITGYKTTAGADTVFPFSKKGELRRVSVFGYTRVFTSPITVNVANILPAYYTELTSSCFGYISWNAVTGIHAGYLGDSLRYDPSTGILTIVIGGGINSDRGAEFQVVCHYVA